MLTEEQSSIAEIMYLTSHPSYYGNYNKNTDWIKEVTQFGQTHQYGVSVSGGGEKAVFRVSGTYDHETGTIIKQSLNRLTTLMNLDYWVSDRIKFSSTFSLTYTKNNKNYDSGILGRAYKAMPNMSINRYEYRETADGVGEYFDTGEYFIMPPRASSSGLVGANSGRTSYYLNDMITNGNPVAIANLAWQHESTYTIKPQFNIEYKLLGKSDDETELNYRGDVYMNAYTYSSQSYYPGSLTSDTWSDGIYKTSNGENKNLEFTTRHQLTFHPHFANTDHQLQVLGRFEITSTNSTSQSHSTTGVTGGITDPTVNGYLTGSSSGTGKSHRAAGTGSIHYAFGSKYIFDFTLRADGSTRFGSGNKWGFFPGVSGRWNISDEKFFKPLRGVISMLAFSPGWGMTGLAPGSEGLMYNKYNRSGVSYNGTQVMYPENLKLTEIRWEKTKSWNIGVNLNLFEDLIRFDLNVYNKKTSDLLNSNVRIPSTTGFARLAWANVGDMENKGVEMEIGYKWYVGKAKFHVKGNASYLKNTLTNLGNTSGYLELDNMQNTGTITRATNGEPFPYFYGYKTNGIFQTMDEVRAYVNDKGEMLQPNAKPGDVRFVDVDKNGTIDAADRTKIGKGMPDWTYGFTFGAEYKGFDFMFMIQGTIGNDIYDATRRTDVRPANLPSYMLNRWTGPGTSNKYPRFVVGDGTNWQSSDLYITDGSYMRLKNIQLGYTLPKNITQRFYVNNLRVYVAAENLLTFTKYAGYDPEISSGGTSLGVDYGVYPQSRTFTVGVNVGF